MKRGILLFLFILSLPLSAQYFPGVNWKSLDQENYFWIYPEEMSEQARELAIYSLKYQDQIYMGLNPQKIRQYPLILYPWTMNPNGYVTPFNHHSLWYVHDPGSSIGGFNWLEELAIHEGRHVAQFNTLYQSTGKNFHLFGGDYFYSLTIVTTPSWLFEGDAVFMETLLSEYGRGRSGHFQTPFRLTMIEDRNYRYDQLTFPSRKRLPTNAYDYGYFYSTWLKETYGEDIVDRLLLRQSQWPMPMWGTTRAFRLETEQPLRSTFREFNNAMKDRFIEAPPWGEEVKWLSEEATPWRVLSHLSYSGGQPVYTSISAQSPRHLFYGDRNIGAIQPQTRMDSSERWLVFDQLRYNDRYPDKTEIEICLQNRKNGNKEVLIRGNYSFPSLTEEGDKLLVVEKINHNEMALLELNFHGIELRRYTFNDTESLSWPISLSNDRVQLVIKRDGRLEIIEIDLDGGVEKSISPLISRPIRQLFRIGENTAFILDREESDVLYKIYNEQPQRLQSGGYGILYGAEGEDGLYILSRESIHGDRLGLIKEPLWSEVSWQEISSIGTGYFDELNLNPVPVLNLETNTIAQEESYGPDFFSPFSWGPYSLAGDLPADLYLPVSLMSQDPLKSNFWEISYLYNNYNGESAIRFFGESNLFFIPFQFSVFQNLPLEESHSSNRSISLLCSLPIGIHRGNRHFSSALTSGINYQYISDINQELFLWENHLAIHYFTDGSIRDIGNRFEEDLSFYFYILPELQEYWMAGFSAGLSFPGPLNQKLALRLSGEKNNLGLATQIANPRGWNNQMFSESLKIAGAYHIPLIYPEIGLGRFIYFSRLRLMLFGESQFNTEKVISSIGGELIFDYYPLQIPVEVYSSIRYSYLLEDEIPKIQITFLGSSF